MRGYGTSIEYGRECIRKDQDIQRRLEMLLDGASSTPTAPVDAGYFQGLRYRVTQRAGSCLQNRSYRAPKRGRMSPLRSSITQTKPVQMWLSASLMHLNRPIASSGKCWRQGLRGGLMRCAYPV